MVLRHPDRVEMRLSVRLDGTATSCRAHVRLPRRSERPPGCALVTSCAWDGAPALFWLSEREVTAGQYLEFLNDPATRPALDAAGRRRLVPRHEIDPPLWPRGADGLFGLPQGTRADHPVLGVSFEDAQAYVRWRNDRAAASGEPWRFRLPSFKEWTSAAGSTFVREYPFGPLFRPRWASSCFARPTPAPEPVMSYPVDESLYGIYDMCGSAMEWVDDWYDAARGLRRVAGGSWAQTGPVAMRIWAPRGARPDRADREFGFRLVVQAAELESR